MRQLDTTPYWMDTGPIPAHTALDRNILVDVVVIGGGITGITAAYLLKKAGKTVALLDRRAFASVDTGHTTAHVTYVTDARLTNLQKQLGSDRSRNVWDAGRSALLRLKGIIDEEEINCGFDWVDGYLHLSAEEREHERAVELRTEAELAASFGFEARFVDRVPLMETPGVRFEGQAVFHPRKYLRGLLASVPGSGSYVCEHTNVDEVQDDPLTVVADGHRISCDYVVVATHTPLRGKADPAAATRLQTKLALYTTYAVAGTVRGRSLPVGVFWDTADPYLHVRVNRAGDRHLAICGGEDHKTGQADPAARYARLEQKIRALIPDIELSHRWSGQVVETIDGLPFIGETSARQFSATGYGGNGMTFGTVAAIMACDAATGRSNPWQALFDPGRTAIMGGLWEYVRENKDYPYHFVRDRFVRVQGSPDLVLERGEGKVVDFDGRRVAAYRDESGAITRLSPVCTHMGCLVAWNGAERTWDCPCHGSRFEPDGQVLAGPAETRLESDVASGRDGR